MDDSRSIILPSSEEKSSFELTDPNIRQRKSGLAVNVGLAANVILAALKTSIGVIGHSPALLADGVNSTSDVAYYLVVAIFMRLARKPADETHPYGHSQMESIASLMVGSFVMTTAIAILWDAINNVFELLVGETQSSGASVATLWIALFTVVVKIILTVFTRRLASETNNPAVLALAYDHRNDIFSAAAAVMGIFLGRQGYPWVDPLVGGLVALVILRTGVEIIRQSSADLMDAVPSQQMARQITELLADIQEVKSVEEIHAHRFGPYLVVNLTIGVDGEISVAEGDCIATEVEDLLYQSIGLLRRVYVHYHPEGVDDPCTGDSRRSPILECHLE
jgi:cation diffusion facilitator family transporter